MRVVLRGGNIGRAHSAIDYTAVKIVRAISEFPKGIWTRAAASLQSAGKQCAKPLKLLVGEEGLEPSKS
jgi:hypothetical protein